MLHRIFIAHNCICGESSHHLTGGRNSTNRPAKGLLLGKLMAALTWMMQTHILQNESLPNSVDSSSVLADTARPFASLPYHCQ